jgi:hypothetical protein
MTAHAFNVNFPIESCVEFFVTWGEIPNAFLGVEGEGRLIKMFAIGPKMTVGVLAASYDVGDFLSAIVDGIAPVESKFLDVQRFVFPIGEVIQIEFFVVNGFHTNEIGL